MKRRIALAFVLMLSFALAAHADNNDDKKTTPMPVRITNVDTNLQVVSTTTNALNIEKVVPWIPHTALGLDVPDLDFMFGQGAKLSVQLIFDTLETKEDVYEKYIRALENLAKVDADRHRPPIVLVTWGGNKNFKGVVESLNVKYTMFLSDGRPARAEVVVSVRETNAARPGI